MSDDKKHNNPPILVEMTPEMADFVVLNCESNMHFALANLQTVSRPTAEKLVEQIENFRALLKAVEDARK